MATNIEIKARIVDYKGAKTRIERLTRNVPQILQQVDTFFQISTGRLKLRQLSPSEGQLIYYQRPDQNGPKLSEYHISHTAEPKSLKHVLGSALGVRGVVHKTRLVYLVENVRIHLDRVEGLGDFIEIEVVFDEDIERPVAEEQAQTWIDNLEIGDGDLIEGAYIDLIEGN